MDKKLLRKIQKLLALGAGDGPEAESAMKKAGELMAANNIGLEDITDGEIKDDGILEEAIKLNAKNIMVWEVGLSHAICSAFGCKQLKRTDSRGSDRLFIGTKSDLQLATWFYKYLRIKIARESEVKFRLVKDQKTFGYGAVETLKDRLLEMFIAKETAMNDNTKALVVAKDAAVGRFIRENYNVRRRKSQPLNISNEAALFAGLEAGRKMSINRPITASKTSKVSPTGARMLT